MKKYYLHKNFVSLQLRTFQYVLIFVVHNRSWFLHVFSSHHTSKQLNLVRWFFISTTTVTEYRFPWLLFIEVYSLQCIPRQFQVLNFKVIMSNAFVTIIYKIMGSTWRKIDIDWICHVAKGALGSVQMWRYLHVRVKYIPVCGSAHYQVNILTWNAHKCTIHME